MPDAPPALIAVDTSPGAAVAISEPPLLVAEKTYNTSHPGYDVNVVRNFPGKIFNADTPSGNSVLEELKKLANKGEVADTKWASVLQSTLAEAKTVPHADLVLQRRDALEQHMVELSARYGARYIAGWVNLDDAIFLYWLVRKLKPETIVQCGVCNGLSSAFMMLALRTGTKANCMSSISHLYST